MVRHTLALASFTLLPTQSSAQAPWPMDRPGFVFDGARRVAVLFGGGDDQRTNGTWEWNGSVWIARSGEGPPTRRSHGLVYDSRR